MATEEDMEVINDLKETIQDLRSRIETLERGGDSTQLDNSSVEDGTVQVNDENGRTKQFVGKQSDGTFAISYKDGPAPEAPSDPTVSARQLAVAVGWDREMVDGSDLPGNLAQVDVHASETSGFTHDGTTIVGSMPMAENTGLAEIGRVLHFSTGGVTTHHVKLVAVNTSGAESEPSNEVSVTPLPAGEIEAGTVTAGKLAAGAVTTDSIAAEAITGKVITGGVFRTAETGQRIEIDGNSSVRDIYLVSSAGGTADIRQYDASVGGNIYSGLRMRSESYSGLVFQLDMHPSVGPQMTALNSAGDRGTLGIEQGQISLQPLGDNPTVIGHSTGRNLEVSGTEVVPWNSGAKDSMSVHANMFTFRSMGEIGHNLEIVGSTAGDGTPVIQSDYNVAIYLGDASGDGGALYINRNAGDNTRCDVYCATIHASNVSSSSSRELKENIRDIPFSTLDTIQNAPAQAYEFKNGAGTSIGPMAEDLPGEISNGEEASLSAMVGLLWDAVSELSAKMDSLSSS